VKNASAADATAEAVGELRAIPSVVRQFSLGHDMSHKVMPRCHTNTMAWHAENP
jgi:hypothetical protein